MNPNIEIINPYLMGVMFSYVELGWITVFPMVNGKISNPHMVLTTDGVLLLNKDRPNLYSAMKWMFNERIMPMSDKELHESIIFMEFRSKESEHDNTAELYFQMLKAEQKRRYEFKVKRRAVKKWQLFKRR